MIRRRASREDTDTIRMRYTYRLAVMMLVGGFLLLVIPTPGITGGEKLAFIAGFFTLIGNFLFNREQQTGNQRSTERAVALGANTAVAPTPPPAPPKP